MRISRVERLRAAGRPEGGRARVFAFRVEATVEGPVDPETGMVANLVDLKRELRRLVIEPLDGRTLDGRDGTPDLRTPEELAAHVAARLGEGLAGLPVVRFRLRDEPELLIEGRGGDASEMDVTRFYEFSASHRLHSDRLSDEENRDVFGKCNNPAGHGHNYGLEVTLRGTPGPDGELFPAARFDALVAREIVDRWDHRNLNEDLDEFRGVNPTAEEIVRIAWERLEPEFRAAGAALHRLKLRETDRNHAEYRGEAS